MSRRARTRRDKRAPWPDEDMTERKYTITVTERQARIISTACDLQAVSQGEAA